MNYYIYILFLEKANLYYVGYSNDPWARLQQHNSNTCDTFTGKFKPWILCAVFDTGTSKQLAIQTEKFIKQHALIMPIRACQFFFFDTVLLNVCWFLNQVEPYSNLKTAC